MLRRADDIPESLEYLWRVFLRLNAFRDRDMDGPRRLSPMHVHYGLLIFGERLSPQEIDAIAEIDATWLATPETPVIVVDKDDDDDEED